MIRYFKPKPCLGTGLIPIVMKFPSMIIFIMLICSDIKTLKCVVKANVKPAEPILILLCLSFSIKNI